MIAFLRHAALLALMAAHAHGPHFGPHEQSRATVYSGPCDGQTRIMADGTTLDDSDEPHGFRGRRLDDHILASTFLRLGTRIRFDRKVFGSRYWTVRDSGGQFDLFRPRCQFGRWDNPTLGYRVVEAR